MAQLPPFGRNTDHDTGRNTQHIASYLQWLSNRNVPLITLALAAHFDRLEAMPDLMLPLVEALHWKGDGSSADLTAVLQHVLQHVPNLTALFQSGKGVLDASPTPKLKILTSDIHPPFSGVCSELIELRLRRSLLWGSLVDKLGLESPHLQLLEISMESVNCNNLLKLLQACPTLQELVLHALRLGKVTEVAAFTQIKRLTFLKVLGAIPQVFASVLGLHHEMIRINDFMFSRKDGRNELQIKDLWVHIRENIFVSF